MPSGSLVSFYSVQDFITCLAKRPDHLIGYLAAWRDYQLTPPRQIHATGEHVVREHIIGCVLCKSPFHSSLCHLPEGGYLFWQSDVAVVDYYFGAIGPAVFVTMSFEPLACEIPAPSWSFNVNRAPMPFCTILTPPSSRLVQLENMMCFAACCASAADTLWLTHSQPPLF